MPPADAPGADWQPSGARRTSERSADVQRLESALDRISAAFVRRAERDAAAAEPAPGHQAMGDPRLGDPALDDLALEDIRRRLDEAIGRVRALLGEPPS